MKKGVSYGVSGMIEREGSRLPGAESPLASWTLGTVQAPPIVAPAMGSTHGRFCYSQVPRSISQSGDGHGRCLPTMRWTRCPQEDGGGVRNRARGERKVSEDDPDLRHDDRRSVGTWRLAGSAGSDPCSHGEHWSVLATDLESARRTLHVVVGQCPSHQTGSRAQDGCWRLRVDCRSAEAWFAEGQLRTRPNSRASRIDPLSDGANAGAGG